MVSAAIVFGERFGPKFVYVYLVLVALAAVWSPSMTVNMVDTAFALMVIPTLTASVLLAPRVLEAMRDYFGRLDRAGDAI